MAIRGVKSVPGFADVLAQSQLPSALLNGPSYAAVGAAGGGKAVGLEVLGRMATGMIQTGLETQADLARSEAAEAASRDAEAAFDETGRPKGLALRGDGTIYGQVYDKAMVTGFLARLDLNASKFAEQLSLDHADDPASWKSKWDQRGQEWLATLPADMQPDARLAWEQKGFKALAPVNFAAHQKVLAEANATLIESMDRSAVEAANAWRTGRLSEAGEAVAKWRQAIDARTDLSAQQKQKAQLDFEDEGRRHAVLGHFDRAKQGGLGRADKFIADFLKPDAHPELHPDFKAKIGAEMSRDLADLKAEHRMAVAELRGSANDAIFRIEHGRPAPQLAALEKKARALGDADLAADLQNIQAQEATLSNLRTQPLGMQIAAVKALHAKASASTDKASVVLAERAQKMLEHQAQAFNPASKAFDPLGQAQASGQLALPPLDMSSTDSLAQRARTAEKLKVFHQLAIDPPPFTAAEADQLASQIASQSREEKAKTLGQLSAGLGPRHFNAALAQIAPKDAAFAQAGNLMAEGNASAARDQLLGAELRSGLAKGGEGLPRQYAPPSDDVMKGALEAALPPSLLADLGPDVAMDIQSAVMNAYVAKSYQKGMANQLVADRKLMAEAARDVTGGYVAFNGKLVLAPKRGMGQDDFDQLLDTLGDNAFAGMVTASGKPVSASMARSSGELRSLSRGRYLLRLTGQTVLNASGQPAVLDLNDFKNGGK